MAEPPRGGWEHAYTVMIIIFFGGKLGIVFLGGSFYPSNTLDRTLHVLLQCMFMLISI